MIGESPEDLLCKHYRWLPLGFRVSRRFGVLVRLNLCRFSGEVDGFLAASCFLAPRSYRQQELIHSSFDQGKRTYRAVGRTDITHVALSGLEKLAVSADLSLNSYRSSLSGVKFVWLHDLTIHPCRLNQGYVDYLVV